MKKAYIIKTSIGWDIHIDEEELPKALRAWKTGNVEQFKQGFVRGDLIGIIVADTERTNQVQDRLDTKSGQRIAGELKPLKDIFEDINFLPKSEEVKKLK